MVPIRVKNRFSPLNFRIYLLCKELSRVTGSEIFWNGKVVLNDANIARLKFREGLIAKRFELIIERTESFEDHYDFSIIM